MKNNSKVLLAAFGAIGLVSVAQAQLSGDIRKNFIASSYDSCYRGQKSSPDNKNTPDKTIAQFCRCSSINVADGLTNELVSAIEKGQQPATAITPIAQLAAKFCMANYSKY